MIKGVLLILGFAALGGALTWVLGPLLLPMLSSAPQQISGLIGTVQGYITPVITYVKDNALQVAAVGGTVGTVALGTLNKIYKANIQKKELETTAKLNDINSQYFQLDAEKRGLENKLDQAYNKMETLESNASTVADITAKYEAKCKEVETVIAERNLLANRLPTVEKAQKLIEDKMKVP